MDCRIIALIIAVVLYLVRLVYLWNPGIPNTPGNEYIGFAIDCAVILISVTVVILSTLNIFQ